MLICVCVCVCAHACVCKCVPACMFVGVSQFLPGSGRIDTAIWMHYLDAKYTTGEKARRQLHKNDASNTGQVLQATPDKAPTVRPPTSHHESYPS